MKAISLVSYIILSILVILLLSTAAQATEYREVKAEKIVKQIETGKDVDYTDCRIVGELNASKMKLRTVLNPEYNEVLNNGFSPEEIVPYGIKKNLSIVKSNITIKDCIFENGLDFSYTIIKGSVDFSGSKFNSPISFSNSYFEDSASFRESTFNDSIDLSKAIFDAYFPPDDYLNKSAEFLGSTFNGSTNLSGAYFKGSAEFLGSTFNGFTDLSGAYFNDSADFSQSTFNAPIRFRLWPTDGITGATVTWFNDSADFSQSTFNAPVYCEGSMFCQNADFIGSTFNDYTLISRASFLADSYFWDATFNAPVDFNKSSFDKTPGFKNLTFNDYVNFSDTDFNFPDDINGPENFKKIITNKENTCNKFRKFYQDEARYNDADNLYYDYRKTAQDNKKVTELSKWSDILSWATCGYGIKPLRIFWPGVFIIGFFTLFYWLGSGIYRSSDADTKKSNVSFRDGLYFSINTFTSLGSVDWYPRENFRKWVTLEELCGWIFLGIFMATLGNVLIR